MTLSSAVFVQGHKIKYLIKRFKCILKIFDDGD